MFYEPSSDFFYDPKTKLYYGNKKRGYFRYDAVAEAPGFQLVGGGEEVGGESQQGQAGRGGAVAMVTVAEQAAAKQALPDPATDTKPEKADLPKPKIAISLKTAMPPKDAGVKSLNEAAAMERTKLEERKLQRQEASLVTAVESNMNAEHAKDMNKWSERKEEMRAGAVPTEIASRVRTTASGQPICVLCRRKFANLEKLQQHERLSALHKENLVKRAAATKAAEDTATEEYRDRSKERRHMYQGSAHVNSGSSHTEALLAHSLDGSLSSGMAKPTEVIHPEETLNAANVGNRLLHKLGWKSGHALGRDGSQGAASMAGNKDVVNNLKSDWERIESLAQRGGGRG